MPSRKVAFQLRVDEMTHDKLQIIAKKEIRSLNAQVEYFIARGIETYEKENGTVEVLSIDQA